MIDRLAEGRGSAIEMRPRRLWRLGLPLVCGGWLVIMAGESPWVHYGVVLGLVTLAIAAWRDYARIEDDVIYVRGVLRWHQPLLLEDVTEVSLHYRTDGRDWPHRELWLTVPRRGTETISLRWWHDWRPFVAAVTSALVDEATTSDGRRYAKWRVHADATTRARMEALVGLPQ